MFRKAKNWILTGSTEDPQPKRKMKQSTAANIGTVGIVGHINGSKQTARRGFVKKGGGAVAVITPAEAEEFRRKLRRGF